jgi:hypothetical protein
MTLGSLGHQGRITKTSLDAAGIDPCCEHRCSYAS